MSHAHDRLVLRFGSQDANADLQYIRWQAAVGLAPVVRVQGDGTKLLAVVVQGRSAIAAVSLDGMVRTVMPAEARMCTRGAKHRRWLRRKINLEHKAIERERKQARKDARADG